MVGSADHHQFGMLRIGIPEPFRGSRPVIGRSLNDEHGRLAAPYRREAILDPFHIETVDRIHKNESSISGHQIILAVRSDTPVLSPRN